MIPALRSCLLLLSTAALAACAQTSAVPPEAMAGTWLVDGVYDSGTRLPTPQEREALENQAMQVSAEQITDPLGRNCPEPTYEIRGTTAARWFGFGNDWLARRGPDIPLTAVTVTCAGAAFDGYAIREDGALVGRYKDAYLVLRRQDDPRVAERLAAVENGRFNRVLSPQTASAGPVVIGGGAEAAEETDKERPPPPKEVLGPTRGELAAMQTETPTDEAAPDSPLLHLASLRSQDAAETEWAAIRDRVPLLRDWPVRYRTVDLPEKGRYVRVYAVPPADLPPADACTRLKDAGQYCRVMRPAG